MIRCLDCGREFYSREDAISHAIAFGHSVAYVVKKDERDEIPRARGEVWGLDEEDR